MDVEFDGEEAVQLRRAAARVAFGLEADAAPVDPVDAICLLAEFYGLSPREVLEDLRTARSEAAAIAGATDDPWMARLAAVELPEEN